jgi:SAM-dependent methyltransferase
LLPDIGLYERDALDGFWRRRVSSIPYPYSDGGAVEERLLRIVTAAADLSTLSLDLAAGLSDWPSHYHLSPMRSNLLRPLVGCLGRNTLEVGAGCGALTRFLGECGGNVLAVEGRPMRARIAARRCRDLPGVTVVSDRLEDLRPEAKFDAVTLIGVPEYPAGQYAGTAAFRVLLETCRRFLAPGGVLIVALENQLGLKYFAGATEVRDGVPMLGINDLQIPGSALTFGRRELEGMLERCGFERIDLLLPLPDYRFPTTILLPRAYSGRNGDLGVATFLASSAVADPRKPRVPVFSLEGAWPVVCRNGLTADLANSFLFVATQGTVTPRWCPPGVLIRHYGARRRAEFCREVSVIEDGAGLRVTRRPMANTKAPEMPVRTRWQDEEYIRGEVWSDRLTAALNRPGWAASDVAAWTEPWVRMLRSRASGLDIHAPLPGDYLDAVPFNVIRDVEGRFRFFDLEWEAAEPVELGYVFFRGLYGTLFRVTSVASPAPAQTTRLLPLIHSVAESLGLGLSPSDVERYCAQENALSEWTTGFLGKLSPGGLSQTTLPIRYPAEVEALSARDSLERRLGEVEQRAHGFERRSRDLEKRSHDLEKLARDVEERSHDLEKRSLDLEETISALENQLESANRAGAELGAGIESIVNSASWRVTAPFRRIAGAFLQLYRRAVRAVFAGFLFVLIGKPLARVLCSVRFRGCGLLLPANPMFDADFYTSAYPDVAGAKDPWAHYLAFGAGEGRNPHPLFDTGFYLAANKDVAASGMNPLVHFCEYGAWEGRDPHPGFSASAYLAGRGDAGDRTEPPPSQR